MRQGCIQHLLSQEIAGCRLESVYRMEPARVAFSSWHVGGGGRLDKFFTPGPLLELALSHPNLHIITDCTVRRILQQRGTATAVETSRGALPLGDAALVLAMGTLHVTTLVRNSFPELPKIGGRFSGHFVSCVVARVPWADLEVVGLDGEGFRLGEAEVGALYVAGVADGDFGRQFHIQLTAVSDRELDHGTPENSFSANPRDGDVTTNSLLRVRSDTAADRRTWDAMDEAAFSVLEEALSPRGAGRVEYWHGSPYEGSWRRHRPNESARRDKALVHESSTLHMGEDGATDPVGLDYKLRGTENVYITGGALWPAGGSCNPTLAMCAQAMDLADRLVPEAPATADAAQEPSIAAPSVEAAAVEIRRGRPPSVGRRGLWGQVLSGKTRPQPLSVLRVRVS